MNIFFLHMNQQICVQMYVDKHIVKMILETCQILCSVWHLSDENKKIYEPPYKLCHKNHPCNIWTRTSLENYKWLCILGIELCKEYTYRYGKIHKSQQYIEKMMELDPPIPSLGFTSPAQAMPDIYKSDDPIESYRAYYFFDKYHIHSWTKREIPDWILETKKLFHN